MNAIGCVKEIYIYPVKSLAGIKLDKCIVTKYGISHPDNSDIIDRFLINLFMLEFSQILSHILFKKMDDSQ